MLKLFIIKTLISRKVLKLLDKLADINFKDFSKAKYLNWFEEECKYHKMFQSKLLFMFLREIVVFFYYQFSHLSLLFEYASLKSR